LKKHDPINSESRAFARLSFWVIGNQLQQQEIKRMAMMISQIQLSSNRLQKQLFMIVPP